MTMYPQPATDRLTIEREIEAEAIVTIADLSGRKISTTTIYGRKSVLELDLRPGMYLLTVGSHGPTQRIVIQ
jgi:hypothetical protein